MYRFAPRDFDLVEESLSGDLTLRKKIGISKEITFGCEIEFENALFDKVKEQIDNKLGSYWSFRLYKDKSVMSMDDDRGGKLSTPILTDTKENWDKLRIICDTLKANGAYTGINAGGYIQIGNNILDKDSLNKLLIIWCIYEHVIYRFGYGEDLYPRSSILLYAPPISEYLFNYLKDGDLSHLSNSDCGGINPSLIKNFDMGNIEFRCPNGTLDPVIWQNNVNLFTKLLVYVSKNELDKDFFDFKFKQYKKLSIDDYSKLYLKDALEFCDLIFDNYTDKVYFLTQYLKGMPEANSYSKIKKFTK